MSKKSSKSLVIPLIILLIGAIGIRFYILENRKYHKVKISKYNYTIKLPVEWSDPTFFSPNMVIFKKSSKISRKLSYISIAKKLPEIVMNYEKRFERLADDKSKVYKQGSIKVNSTDFKWIAKREDRGTHVYYYGKVSPRNEYFIDCYITDDFNKGIKEVEKIIKSIRFN